MPSLTREVKHGSEQERKILAELRSRVGQWNSISSKKNTKWREAEEKVLAYLPEREVDVARRNSRENGLPQYTTIQIPYTYAVIMSAHTYMTSVFMGRDPTFQYSGRHGESQQQVQAMEALVAYQTQVGWMLPYFYTWLYDSLKYGVSILGLYWENRIENVTTIQEQPILDLFGQDTGKTEKVQTTQQFRTYSGNKVYNIQPQDFIWDTRLPLREYHRGEFCGERTKMKWADIVRQAKAGQMMNVDFVKDGTGKAYYGNDEGSSQLERPELFSQLQDNGGYEQKSKKSGLIGIIQLIIEIIPSEDEWKLSSSDYPEKWVFKCTDDFKTLLAVQPLGAYHCKFPYSVIPMEPEGYGLTTRGLPEVLTPVQNTVDWLINSHFFNVRAALNNKYVVDPSKIVMKDLLDPLPGGVIRMKPSAYGQDAKGALNQLPIQDVTRSHLQDFSAMLGIGERVAGVNDQIMGMMNGGGRKTATEVRTSTSFGINRLKTMCEFASATSFDPLSQMLVQNSQQYFDMELKFRIAGDLAMGAGRNFMMVNPDSIAGYYDFVNVDGTLPIDRFAQVGMWKDLFQTVLAIPQIGMQYDLGGIFQWVAQLAGLKNITQFKVQIAPDDTLEQQAQKGNVIPMRGGGPKGTPQVSGPPAMGGM